MKKLIFAAILSFLIFLALKLLVVFTELNILVEVEYFMLFGISLAFCWSALLYLSENHEFSIGVNITWLCLAFPGVVYYLSVPYDWLLWVYLFFFIFPLGFLIKYLFFTKELRNVFLIRITSLITFAVLAIIASILKITI